ncbi:Early nodulin-like protein 1 [Melia azedarach]|uniref:Early nodulin-like protein 1 n=1 Tax=Melia azedarach TaxID=155640 RepID=A0ACC1XQX7_MELAZ|nr:Early nodulin-like protein 1 [Melia azedarach]
MASFCKLSFFLILFPFLAHVCTASSSEFEVGGDDGWVVPKSKDDDAQMYNHWASGKRFKTGDTLQFKYKKDSVMEVSEEEYKKCRSSRPLMYSNNGNTMVKLDRPGLYYFISGVSGHCERGQKMIIKVLEPVAATPPHPQNQTNTTPGSSKKNAATTASPTAVLLLIFSFSGFIFSQF